MRLNAARNSSGGARLRPPVIAPTPKISTGIDERQDQHRRDQPAAPERHGHRGADGAERRQRRRAEQQRQHGAPASVGTIHRQQHRQQRARDDQRQRRQQPVRDHFCGNHGARAAGRRGAAASASRPRDRRGTAGRARAAWRGTPRSRRCPGASRASSARSGPMANGTIGADHDEEQHQRQHIAAAAQRQPQVAPDAAPRRRSCRAAQRQRLDAAGSASGEVVVGRGDGDAAARRDGRRSAAPPAPRLGVERRGGLVEQPERRGG